MAACGQVTLDMAILSRAATLAARKQLGARAMLSKAFTIASSNDLPAPLSLFDHIWCRFFDDPTRRNEPAPWPLLFRCCLVTCSLRSREIHNTEKAYAPSRAV
jgi:hypothetical protein